MTFPVIQIQNVAEKMQCGIGGVIGEQNMSDRKYQLAYVVARRNTVTNESIPCAIFQHKDREEAENTADAYNQQFTDQGLEGYVFEVHCTALFD